ncbi:hypothetical protein ONS95_008897 [Cadophora gregata]|uniref:uncharacterized protein n=1 Tax=Cadophora gregata TaxID=51156 RepID=UPI0026DD8839|nr:uncharacterized protein ONS95_008897 [Cadophora gregata]KAK0123905.1 hypothetical protein ONS95_008897 [Cadophora gregata]
MPDSSNHIEFLLQAANSDIPDSIPWSNLKFMLKKAGVDASTIDEVEAMNLFRNIRRGIKEEREDGMRDASREHIDAVLALANSDGVPDDMMSDWPSLKFCLTLSNKSLPVPDSANWLRSFTRFRRIIAGGEVEQDDPQHALPPSGAERAQSDSAYDSQYSESDPKDDEYLTVVLDSCDKYKSGTLSIPYTISDKHGKHFMLPNAARRCDFNPDRSGVVRVRCFLNDNPESSEVKFHVEDHLEDVDIVLSRKLLDADKKRNSSIAGTHCYQIAEVETSIADLLSYVDQRRRRDHSRSAGSSAEYIEEEVKAVSYALGIAFQNPGVRNLDEKGTVDLGYKMSLALRGAHKARPR